MEDHVENEVCLLESNFQITGVTPKEIVPNKYVITSDGRKFAW
jgi:hypothetical protein